MRTHTTTADTPTVPTPAVRSARRVLLPALAAVTVVFVVIGLSAFAGYRAGLAERSRHERENARQAADEQFSLGLLDMAGGRYELARQRFEYILQVNPDYPGAAERLEEVLRQLNATATPTALPTPSTQQASELFAHAEELSRDRNWKGVIETITTLRGIDPTYETIRADDMMFVALRNWGLEQILAGALELGLYDFYQAEQIGPLDAEADGYRLWAELYLAADSYWGLSWERAAYYYGQLYASAPYFLDTFDRLYQATRNYADQLAGIGDYCAAEQQYREAQRLLADPEVADLYATAQAKCLLATPTPDPNSTPMPTELTPTAELSETATPGP